MYAWRSTCLCRSRIRRRSRCATSAPWRRALSPSPVGPPAGPVQLNLPFRKPLEPAGDARAAVQAAVAGRLGIHAGLVPPTLSRGTLLAAPEQLEQLAGLLNDHPRGLIVCGPGCPDGAFPAAVSTLARRAGYPIAADPLSGLRSGPHTAATPLLAAYETSLAGGRAPAWAPPTLVLRFGAVPTSKWLNAYLDELGDLPRVHVRASGVWADDSQRTTWFLQADEAALCAALTPRLRRTPDSAWLAAVAAEEATAWQALEDDPARSWWDGAALQAVFSALPANTRVTIGNSLPIRHVDQLIPPTTRPLALYGNRGASGIDGVISSALGAGAAGAAPVALLIGDISFYHDMNGLLALRHLRDVPVTIFLFNNDGGGIFRRLPVAGLEPPFTDLFATPHGLDFSGAAALYGLEHVRVGDRAALAAALARPWVAGTPRLVEITSSAAADEAQRKALVAAVQTRLGP